jgi:hypothetical protein
MFRQAVAGYTVIWHDASDYYDAVHDLPDGVEQCYRPVSFGNRIIIFSGFS